MIIGKRSGQSIQIGLLQKEHKPAQTHSVLGSQPHRTEGSPPRLSVATAASCPLCCLVMLQTVNLDANQLHPPCRSRYALFL